MFNLCMTHRNICRTQLRSNIYNILENTTLFTYTIQKFINSGCKTHTQILSSSMISSFFELLATFVESPIFRFKCVQEGYITLFITIIKIREKKCLRRHIDRMSRFFHRNVCVGEKNCLGWCPKKVAVLSFVSIYI